MVFCDFYSYDINTSKNIKKYYGTTMLHPKEQRLCQDMSQNIAITMVACLKVMVKPRYLTAMKHNTRINDDNFFIYEVTLKMQLIETEIIGKHLLYDDSDLKFILIFF